MEISASNDESDLAKSSGDQAKSNRPASRRSMDRVALRMLMGDRAKFLSLIFSITFSTFLISQQLSIFCGLMERTRGQITDVGGNKTGT